MVEVHCLNLLILWSMKLLKRSTLFIIVIPLICYVTYQKLKADYWIVIIHNYVFTVIDP